MKQRKKKNKHVHYSNELNESQFLPVIKGFLHSIQVLNHEEDIHHNSGDTHILVPGLITVRILLAAHSAEVLLKCKIFRQEGSYPHIHNLFHLYNRLDSNTKLEIQKKYDENPNPYMTDNWNNVEFIFKKCQNTPISGRYAMLGAEMKSTFPGPLEWAARSVLQTMPDIQEKIQKYRRIEDNDTKRYAELKEKFERYPE